MAEENRLEVQIVLDDGSIQKGFVKLEQQADKSSKNISSSLTSVFGGIQGKLLAAASALAGAFTFKAAVGEAIQAENAVTKFNLALNNAGAFSKAATQSFQSYAQSLEQLTAIDADLITENASLLVSIGNLTGQGLEKATRASLDLSKGLGIDVGSAFELVSKAASGNAGALSRYGIKIDETLPKSEQFAAALFQIERRFGGIAEASSNTFSGSLERVSVSFNNLLETFGRFFTESPVLRETFKFISSSFDSLNSTIAQFSSQDVVGNIIKQVTSLAVYLSQTVGPLIEVFIRSIVTGGRAIESLFFGLLTGFLKIESFLIENVFQPIVNGFTKLATTVIGIFNKDLANQILASVQNFTQDFLTVTKFGADQAGLAFGDSFNKLSTQAETTFNTDISGSVTKFLENYQLQIDQAKVKNKELEDSFKNTGTAIVQETVTVGSAFSLFAEGFDSAAKDIAASASKNFKQAGAAALQGLGQAGSSAFAAFGKALASGEDALAAFGDALLASIGQIAVQLGTNFILQGIAYIFAGLPNGPSLIAAGAALATFGGILSAVGSKGKATPSSAPLGASGGGGVAGGVSAPVTNEPAIADAEAEQVDRGPRIEVNIAGDVLDSQETGIRIVDLINQAFDQNGAVVTGAV